MKKILFFCLLTVFCWQAQPAFCAEDDWLERKTIHFVVFFNNAPLDFIKNVEVTAEECYDEIVRHLGFYQALKGLDDNRIKIYIYDDQKVYDAEIRQMQGTQGVAYFRHRTIRTFPSAHGFFDTTLPHELGHIIFREFVGYDCDLPLWIDEGVAMFQEKARRWGAHQTVNQALQEKHFIPLKELSQTRLKNLKNRQTLDLFYAEAASIVYYMIKELGEYRFLNFCNALKTGQEFEPAFKNAYRQFNAIQDLENSWVHYLEGNKRNE